MKWSILLLICVLSISKSSYAQSSVPLLERSVTVNFTDEPIGNALKIIAEKAGFAFSYNSSIIDESRRVTANFTQKTVRQILDQIFAGEIQYREKPKHIILSRTKATGKSDGNILKGYVVDEATGERIRDVTVYEPVTLNSAITNSYGYFEIKMSKSPEHLKLVVNKESYSDTLVAVQSKRGRLLNIPIRIDKEKIATRADTLRQRIKRFWKTQIMNPDDKNIANVTDTLFRTSQFSVLPYIGTNHELSGNVINDYSFNLLGGYSSGVRKFELGGLFNRNRGDVQVVQIAGLFNTLGGKMTGVQMAGIFNANYNGTYGAQLAGIANINWNSSRYFSAAGIINFTRLTSEGVHFAGLGNFTLGEQKGVHTAGLFNFCTRDARALQLSGIMNFAVKNFRGLQLAGLFNFTGRKLEGTQIGFLNYATKTNGSQFGLLNITDSINGIPFGVLSLVMKGYHKIEISADEIFYSNLAFRTGVRQFYNILTVGLKPHTLGADQTYWTFGYGIGTAPKINRILSLNLDLTANQIIDDGNIDVINLLNKLYVGFDLQAAKHLSVTFGATLNGYLTEINYDEYEPLFTSYTPDIIEEKKIGDRHLQMWLGGKVGLRFL
jgi:hypothetical protein